VLLPPEGFDENDEPVFSSAAIERAVMYARLLDGVGRPRALAALWGNGADLPATKLLAAFRTVYEEDARRLEVEIERLSVLSSSTRRQRQHHEELRSISPQGASRMNDQAQSKMGTTPTSVVFTKHDDKKDDPPKLSEARAEIYAEMAAVMMTGGEESEGTEALLAAVNANDDVRSAVEAEGGTASVVEKLDVLDRCEVGALGFDRLVAMRDAMRSALTEHAKEVTEAIPAFGPLLAALTTPEHGLIFADSAVIGLVLELRAQNLTDEGEEGAESA
jgi:hypothetical protein